MYLFIIFLKIATARQPLFFFSPSTMNDELAPPTARARWRKKFRAFFVTDTRAIDRWTDARCWPIPGAATMHVYASVVLLDQYANLSRRAYCRAFCNPPHLRQQQVLRSWAYNGCSLPPLPPPPLLLRECPTLYDDETRSHPSESQLRVHFLLAAAPAFFPFPLPLLHSTPLGASAPRAMQTRGSSLLSPSN